MMWSTINYIHQLNSDTHREILNQNQIVLIIFRLIWNQTDVHLVQNQWKNGKYNLISLWFNKISKRFLYAYNRWNWPTQFWYGVYLQYASIVKYQYIFGTIFWYDIVSYQCIYFCICKFVFVIFFVILYQNVLKHYEWYPWIFWHIANYFFSVDFSQHFIAWVISSQGHAITKIAEIWKLIFHSLLNS